MLGGLYLGQVGQRCSFESWTDTQGCPDQQNGTIGQVDQVDQGVQIRQEQKALESRRHQSADQIPAPDRVAFELDWSRQDPHLGVGAQDRR